MIRQDWSTLKKLMFLKTAAGGSVAEDTATGNPMSFNTNLAKQLKSLIIPFTPVQSGSGNPSPTNVRPISGVSAVNVWRTGENLLDYDRIEDVDIGDDLGNRKGVTFTKAGKYYIKALRTRDTGAYLYARAKNADGTYNSIRYIVGNTTVTNQTITLTEGQTLLVFNASTGVNGTVEKTIERFDGWGIVVSFDDMTEYSPYTGQSYNITFPALGKNLFYRTGEISNSFINENGYISTDEGWIVSNYIPVAPNTQYTFTPNSTAGVGGKHAYYTDEKVFISVIGSGQQTFTTPENCYYMRFSYRVASSNIMLNTGSTAEPYEPYTNTVYGGSLDVTTGVLTVEWGVADLGGLSWITVHNGDVYWFYSDNIPNLKIISSSSVLANIISDRYKTVKASNIYNGSSGDNVIGQDGDVPRIRIRDDSFENDDNAFKTAMNGIYFCHELATPITYQLTPQQITALLGDNVLWSDTNGNNTAVFYKKG